MAGSRGILKSDGDVPGEAPHPHNRFPPGIEGPTQRNQRGETRVLRLLDASHETRDKAAALSDRAGFDPQQSTESLLEVVDRFQCWMLGQILPKASLYPTSAKMAQGWTHPNAVNCCFQPLGSSAFAAINNRFQPSTLRGRRATVPQRSPAAASPPAQLQGPFYNRKLRPEDLRAPPSRARE